MKKLIIIGLIILAIRQLTRQKTKLLLAINIDKFTKIKGDLIMVQITDTQTVTGTLQPVDKKGNAAQVQTGSVKFISSDESIFTVTQDPDDELKVTITAQAPGVAQLNYSADADLGDGTTTVEGFTGVEVQGGPAVGFGVAFDAPTEQA